MISWLKKIISKREQQDENFNHILLTRFNIVEFKNLQKTKRGAWLDPEWLKIRFELFEKFCLPSIKSQTNKNFTWFIFFHIDTPEEYKQKIKEYQQSFPILKPIFLESEVKPPDILPSLIQTHLPKQKWIITSRVDNDDSIACDFIENIQGEFLPKHRLFLDFPKGYKIKTTTNTLYNFEFKSNAFISCIEKSIKMKSALYFSHTEVSKKGELKHLYSKPMWIQVIHGGNLVNNLNDTNKSNNLIDFNNRFFIINKELVK